MVRVNNKQVVNANNFVAIDVFAMTFIPSGHLAYADVKRIVNSWQLLFFRMSVSYVHPWLQLAQLETGNCKCAFDGFLNHCGDV